MINIQPKLKRQLIVTLAGAGSIALAIGISTANMGSFEKEPLPEKAPQYPKVSIQKVSPASYQAHIAVFGSAQPRYSLDVITEVSGQVTFLSEKLQSGQTLKKGELMLTLDDRPYQQAVANAQTQVSDARIAYLQEELNVQQAQQEWQRSGLSGLPDSELVLRQPQLKAAKNKLEYAQKSLIQAQADLQKSHVKSPFSALVINRSAQPGAYLPSGSQVSQLYSTDVMDISLALSAAQWQQLPPLENMIEQKWKVTLMNNSQQSNTAKTEQWEAVVTRGEQHINSASRQRSLIVSVSNPLNQNPPLYPGTFVEASINGKSVENLWQLPASAITQNNQLWYMDDNGLLQSAAADIRFSNANNVYVDPLPSLSSTQVLLHPLGSYLVGMKVEADSKTSQLAEGDL